MGFKSHTFTEYSNFECRIVSEIVSHTYLVYLFLPCEELMNKAELWTYSRSYIIFVIAGPSEEAIHQK